MDDLNNAMCWCALDFSTGRFGYRYRWNFYGMYSTWNFCSGQSGLVTCSPFVRD